MVESSGEAMVSLDAEGGIASWNRAAERLFGRSRAEALGERHTLLVPPERLAEDDALMARIARSGEPETIETQRLAKGGELVDVSLEARRIADADGSDVGAVLVMRDLRERKRLEREVRAFADRDALTDLCNRRWFEQELIRQVALAGRHGSPGALLLVDLDNFRRINDGLGHAAGDEVIREIAARLEKRVRASDVVARVGGDEFALLLPFAEMAEAEALAGDLMELIRGKAVRVQGGELAVTASIGVVGFAFGEATDAESLLTRADLALDEAKGQGRNRVVVGDADIAEAVAGGAGQASIQRVRGALQRGRMMLEAQPILNLGTREVEQHELLLRMRDGTGGLIPPAAFLTHAERAGMIEQIDRWVVRRAIRLIHLSRGNGAEPCLSVNLSARSVGDGDMLRLIADELERFDVDPAKLILEVTETAAIAAFDRARRFAVALTSLGCRIALDDFGTGFGSLMHLKRLPVDFLKIDGQFVRHLPESSTDDVLVGAMVEIAHGLGMQTVAECVEQDETLADLAERGVDYAQGHLIARPAPAHEVFGVPEAELGERLEG